MIQHSLFSDSPEIVSKRFSLLQRLDNLLDGWCYADCRLNAHERRSRDREVLSIRKELDSIPVLMMSDNAMLEYGHHAFNSDLVSIWKEGLVNRITWALEDKTSFADCFKSWVDSWFGKPPFSDSYFRSVWDSLFSKYGLQPQAGEGLFSSPVEGLLSSPVEGLPAQASEGLLSSPVAGLPAQAAEGLLSSSVAGLPAQASEGLLSSPVAGLPAQASEGLLSSPVAGLPAQASEGLLSSLVAGLPAQAAEGLLSSPVAGLPAQAAEGLLTSLVAGLPAQAAEGLLSSPVAGLQPLSVFISLKGAKAFYASLDSESLASSRKRTKRPYKTVLDENSGIRLLVTTGGLAGINWPASFNLIKAVRPSIGGGRRLPTMLRGQRPWAFRDASHNLKDERTKRLFLGRGPPSGIVANSAVPVLKNPSIPCRTSVL